MFDSAYTDGSGTLLVMLNQKQIYNDVSNTTYSDGSIMMVQISIYTDWSETQLIVMDQNTTYSDGSDTLLVIMD